MINSDEYQKYIESIVRKIVYMFPDVQLSAEDLRQRGWLELIKAAGRYDAESGAKFTTYAYKAVEEGMKEEAIFQINRSGVTGRKFFTATDSISVDEENGVIEMLSEQVFLYSDEGNEDRERAEQLRRDLQRLTENEKNVLYMAYGIDCERCANPKKIAKALDMSELEVKRALESGKGKLEELSDGRKQGGTGSQSFKKDIR